MEKAYVKLLAEYKLTEAELPQDAKIAIKSIKDIEIAITLADKKSAKAGQTYSPSSEVMAKIKALDKWVVREILDYVEDKETNTAKPAVDTAKVIEEIKSDAAELIDNTDKPVIADPKGLKIDAEFTELLKNNKSELSLDDLKLFAPVAYSTVFDNYDQGGDNGIDTSFYILKEQNEVFTLTKK